MSEFIDFFAAPDDAAAAGVRSRGPAGIFSAVAADEMYFDADDAVVAWCNLLAGRPGLHMSSLDHVRMVADWQNDGSAVFALPDELVSRLIEASPDQLRAVAAVWVPVVVAEGAEFGEETVVALLAGIAELARAEAGTGNRLYCWVAL